MGERRVVVLQHSEHGGPGSIATCAERRGMPLTVVRRDRGEALPSLDGVSGLAVLGGPREEEDPEATAERVLIANALRVGVRVLGICHGAQALAASQGGRIVRAGETRAETARIDIAPGALADPLLGPEAPSMKCFLWHRHEVDLPPGALRLAGDRRSPDLAFRLGRGWGLLFHVEVDEALAEAWRPFLPEGTTIDAKGLSELGERVIDRWLARVEAAGR